ncbi:MAG: 3-deoxy-D-manno-octulosonic acid kinase [Rhodanobacter sp.]|jgi:3-deoxy-D-manno-octulosonic acid kinase|nr:3-deoxy-D-manno-octulosonic acid kinase [Rhodanobacter sp.]
MINTQVQFTASGAIMFDRALGFVPDDAWFDAPCRSSASSGDASCGGRGGVVFIDTPLGVGVLRHYHRGGLAARISADQYVWLGARRTRAFREFHLLAKLIQAGLPVPAPVAARYVRHGLQYRADLVTRRIDAARTLAERLAQGTLDPALAHAIGRTIALFHAAGVWHADLNAHNILTGAGDAVWLIDFDRGRFRKPRLAWQQANLTRLRRSLDKLGASGQADFDAAFWHPLLAAYHRALSLGEVATQAGGTCP